MSHACCCFPTAVPIFPQNHTSTSKGNNPGSYTSPQSSWNNVCALNSDSVTYATTDAELQLRDLRYYGRIAAAFEVFFDLSNL